MNTGSSPQILSSATNVDLSLAISVVHIYLGFCYTKSSEWATWINIWENETNQLWIETHLEHITLHTGQTNVFLTSSWSTSSWARHDTWYTRWQVVQQITSPPAWHSKQYQSWPSFTNCNTSLHQLQIRKLTVEIKILQLQNKHKGTLW